MNVFYHSVLTIFVCLTLSACDKNDDETSEMQIENIDTIQWNTDDKELIDNNIDSLENNSENSDSTTKTEIQIYEIPDDLPILETTAKLSDVLTVADAIKNFAGNYSEYSSKPELLVAQYGRITKYNSTTWKLACGVLRDSIKKEMDSYESLLSFSKVETIILPNGETLDAPHFWAALNGMIEGTGDLCGWAGDLVTFANDNKSNSSIEFPSNSFNAEDWRSDADAYNIYKSQTDNLMDAIKKYATSDLTEKFRVNKFLEGGNDISTRFSKSSNKQLLKILMNKYSVNETDIENAALKMQTYLDQYAE